MGISPDHWPVRFGQVHNHVLTTAKRFLGRQWLFHYLRLGKLEKGKEIRLHFLSLFGRSLLENNVALCDIASLSGIGMVWKRALVM